MYQEDGEKKTFFENHEKKSPRRPFLAHPAGGQETTFYLRVASVLNFILTFIYRENEAKANLKKFVPCPAVGQNDGQSAGREILDSFYIFLICIYAIQKKMQNKRKISKT